MEETDKTYLWLVILTFIGLAAATAFSLMEMSELRQDNVNQTSPFSPS